MHYTTLLLTSIIGFPLVTPISFTIHGWLRVTMILASRMNSYKHIAGICKGMQGYARVCRGMQGYARVCKGKQGYTGIFRGYRRVYKGMQGYARVSMNMQGIQGYTRVCKGIQGYAWIYKGMQGYARVCRGMKHVMWPGNHRTSEIWLFKGLPLALYPGPAPLSIASSTVKRERAWYLFSCE